MMNGYDAAIWSLVGTAFLYAVFALLENTKYTTVKTFFHNPSKFNNTISLIAANITLGTGVLYLIAAGEKHGILMALLPFAVLAGYILFARESEKVAAVVAETGPNILLILKDKLQKLGFAINIAPITLSIILAYIAFLSFELTASSQFLASVIAPTPNLPIELGVSVNGTSITRK